MYRKTKLKLLLAILAISTTFQSGILRQVYAAGENDKTHTAPESTSCSGNTLGEVAVTGDLDEFKRLITPYCVYNGETDEIINKLNEPQNRYGDTVLHLAILHGNFQLVKYILENFDVDLSIKNNQGETPIDVAHNVVNGEIVEGVRFTPTKFYKWLSSWSANSSLLCQNPPGHIALTVRAIRIEEMIKNIGNIRSIIRNDPSGWQSDIDDILQFVTPDTVNINIDSYPLIDLVAVRCPSRYTVKLLENGAKYPEGLTAGACCLHNTLLQHRPDLFKKLIRTTDIQMNSNALQAAILEDNKDLVEFLIQNGANVNATSLRTTNTKPLHLAASLARFEITKLLVEHGADLDAQDYNGSTALNSCYYCHEISHETIQFLIQQGADVNKPDYNGKTPLHKALEGGFCDIISLLIQHGADVNAANHMYERPLELAIFEYKRMDVAKLLIDSGADINCPNISNQSLLNRAIDNSDLDLIQFLVNNGADVNCTDTMPPLIQAVARGNYDIIKYLIEHGANANQTDTSGATALYRLVTRRPQDIRIAKLLVEHGANVNFVTPWGEGSLISLAIKGEKYELAELLAENGADTNTTIDYSAEPLLCYAIQKKCEPHTLETLLKHGAKSEVTNFLGESPLYITIENGDLQNAEILLKYGANPNSLNGHLFKHTPLHNAVDAANIDAVKLLLNSPKTNVNTQDSLNRGPLSVAIEAANNIIRRSLIKTGYIDDSYPNYYNFTQQLSNDDIINQSLIQSGYAGEYQKLWEIAKLLIEHGANTNLKNTYGHTPLGLAKMGANFKFQKLLITHGALE